MKKSYQRDAAVILSGAMLLLCLPAAHAQNFRVEVTSADQHDYICDVAKIADDLMARDLSGRSSNFWTKTMQGGKFQSVEPTKVRVAASAPEAARNDLFLFYQKYASSVRGTFPDKGQLPVASVVKNCVADPSSTRGIKAQSISLEKYKVLLRDREHLMKFFALNTTRLTDEQVVTLANPNIMVPTDAFDRKAFFEKEGKRINAEIASADKGPFILEGDIKINAYDFSKGGFELPNVVAVAESFKYTYDMNSRITPQMPKYKFSGQLIGFYKPASTDEAKKIESARSKGELSMRTFVQPTKAWLNGTTPEIDGVIAKVEVRSKSGDLLFALPAN